MEHIVIKAGLAFDAFDAFDAFEAFEAFDEGRGDAPYQNEC